MATANRRDVEVALRVTTQGEEGIKQLEAGVRDLAKQGGAAAPEFNKLADEIAKLGQQAKVLEAFSELDNDVRQLSASNNTAAETTQVLYGELQKLSTASRVAGDAEQKLRNELRTSQQALQSIKDAIRLKRIETDADTKSTDTYQTSIQQMRREQLTAEKAVRALKDKLNDAKNATNQASAAEGEIEKKYRASSRAADEERAALSARNSELEDAKKALRDAGVATEDLANAQVVLLGALNKAGSAAKQLDEQQREAIALDKQRAAEEEKLAIVVENTRRRMQEAARAEADGIIRDFARVQQAEREAQAEAKRVSDSIRDAFSTVGAKSVGELQTEIERVRAAMNTLRGTAGLTGVELDAALASGNKRIKDLERQIRAASNELTFMDKATNLLKTTFGQFTAAFTLVEVVQRLGGAFFTATKQIESLRLGLTQIYGSAETAGKQIDFLRTTASRAGISVGAISDSFVKFSTSLNAANIPLQQSNELFAAVTQAAGTLGLSGDNVSRALEAISQSASKGTVQMEELRGQLGDALPGVLPLLAKALGLTNEELITLVESGGLLTSRMVPALITALRGLGGDVNSLSATWERFTGVFVQAMQNMAESGGAQVLTWDLKVLGGALQTVLLGLNVLAEGSSSFGRAAVVVFETLRGRGGPAMKNFRQETDKATARLAKQAEAFINFLDPVNNAAKGTLAVGAASQSTAAAVGAATVGVTAHSEAMLASQGASGVAAAGQTALTAATTGTAKALNLTGLTFEKAVIILEKYNKSQRANVELAEKVVKSNEFRARSIEMVAQLTGNERQILEASTNASRTKLLYMNDERRAREAEIVGLTQAIELLKREVALNKDPEGVLAKKIEEKQRLLEQRKEEAARTREEIDGLRIEVAQRELTRQSYEDNSASLGKLRTAAAEAQVRLKALQVLEINGKATREQVAEATIIAAKAVGLYADAMKDASDKAGRDIQAIQNRSLVTQAALALDMERAKSLESLAKSSGDEALATYASTQQKEIEIKARKASAEAMTQEANAAIANAKAQLADLEARNALTPAIRTQIETTIASAEAKKLDAQRLAESTKALQDEVNAIRNGTTARKENTAAVNENISARERDIASREKALELTRRENALKEEARTVRDTAGNVVNAAGNTYASLLAKLKGMGVDEQGAATIARQFTDSQGNVPYFNNPGQRTFGNSQFDTIDAALSNAASKYLLNKNTSQPIGAVTTPKSAEVVTTASRTVNINIGGQTTTIGVASQADSDALVGMLRRIETTAQRTI